MKFIFQKSMGYVVAILVTVLYFVMSYLTIDDWSITSAKTIAGGLLLFVCAIMVYSSLMKQGILNGRCDDKYINTVETHIRTKEKISPKIRYLQPWLDKDWKVLTRVGRTTFTDSAGLDYSEMFEENGKYKKEFTGIEKPKAYQPKTRAQRFFKPIIKLFRLMFSSEWRLYRERTRYIRMAMGYKVTRLTVASVVNIDSEEDPNNFGISEATYVKKQNAKNFVSRLMLFIVPSVNIVLSGFSLETLLIQLVNIMLVIITGLVSMFAAYFFIVRTHRSTIIKMINKLEEFDNADLSEFKEKEKKDEQVHTEKPLSSETNLVQEISEYTRTGQEGNLCSQSDCGV